MREYIQIYDREMVTLVIYIDSLICVNIFIDSIILYTIKRILHIHCKNYRVILASVFAGVSTISVFLPYYTLVTSILLRISIAATTVLIAFGYQSPSKFTVRSLCYIGTSMLVCASVITVELLWNPKGCAVYNDTIYFDISPVLLITTTLLTYSAISIYQKLNQKNKLNCAVKKVRIQTDKKTTLTFNSAIDTGCNLKEPFSGLPVIIVEKDIINTSSIAKSSMRVIPFSTVASSDIIMGFKPYKVFIEGKELLSGCYIGICCNKLHGEIKSIMGTDILEAL